MATTTNPALRGKYRVTYKLRCAETNKCTRCPKANDNPTSFICRACTDEQRNYQRQHRHRRRQTDPAFQDRLRAQWARAQQRRREAA